MSLFLHILYYVHLLLVRILGGVGLTLKCCWLVWILTFRLHCASGGKAEQIRLIWFFRRCCWVSWSASVWRWVRSVFRSGFVCECTLQSKLGWIIFFPETCPCCHLQWKLNPNGFAGAAADFNKGLWRLVGHTEMSGGCYAFVFLCFEVQGEVRGASMKLSAFISCSRIRGQEWCRTTDVALTWWIKTIVFGLTCHSLGQQKEDKCLSRAACQPSAKAVGLAPSRSFPGIPGATCSAQVSSGSDAYCSTPFVLLRWTELLQLSCVSRHFLSLPFFPCFVFLRVWGVSELRLFCAFVTSWVWAVQRTAGA